MKNTSIEQLNQEVLTAKKQALRDPYQFERSDNGLSDMMSQRLNISSTRAFPAAVREKVDLIFDKYPDQLKTLGLYYDAGFTTDEIADMNATTPQNVKKSLSRAKARLKKHLTDVEYNAIRWFIGDHKVLEATQDRHVNPFYNDFVDHQPILKGRVIGSDGIILWNDGTVSHRDSTRVKLPITGQHPPEKQLPKGSFYYEVQSIETGTISCVH